MKIQKEKFKISLKFFTLILSIIHTIHTALQSEDATLSSSTNLIISVINQLNLLRFDEEFNKFIEQFDNQISSENVY